MRAFLGMIVGCLLTIVVVYVHDKIVVPDQASGETASSRVIVNWDAASGEWARVTSGARVAWDRLTDKART